MKKIGLIIAAFALVLELTQCRKPNTSTWIGGYSKQTITFSNSSNDGQKGLFQEDVAGVLNYHWQTGDVIHVYATTNPYSEGNTDFGTNSMYCGVLDNMTIITPTKASFTGDVNVPDNAKAFRFVHYGKDVDVVGGAATVNCASQTGKIEDISDKVIVYCDKPYTGIVYEGCSLKVAFAVLKFSFANFESDIKVTLKTLVNTKITVAAGGAISYNTPGEIDFNITSSTDKSNNKEEYFAVMMPKEETIYTFSDGSKRATGSIVINENGYYTTSGGSIIVNTETVYIKPSEITYTSVVNNPSLGESSCNGFIVTATSRPGWERMFIPIHNLEIGQWYTITFGETITKSTPGDNNWWCEEGTYSSNVQQYKNEGNDSGTNIPYVIGQNPGKFVCVMCLGYWNPTPYVPTPKVSTTFQATAETMLWTIESSQFGDNVTYTWNISLVDYGIKKIVPENSYYADMPNSTMYGYLYVENAAKGLCSFKVYADYHTIDFYSYGANAHEKFNVPLKGLTVGQKYRLTFDYTRTNLSGGGDIAGGSELDNCFGISQTENTNYGSSNLHGTSGTGYAYGDNFTDNHLSGKTIEFTATATTMYWVWSQSKLNDAIRFHQVAENITLEAID